MKLGMLPDMAIDWTVLLAQLKHAVDLAEKLRPSLTKDRQGLLDLNEIHRVIAAMHPHLLSLAETNSELKQEIARLEQENELLKDVPFKPQPPPVGPSVPMSADCNKVLQFISRNPDAPTGNDIVDQFGFTVEMLSFILDELKTRREYVDDYIDSSGRRTRGLEVTMFGRDYLAQHKLLENTRLSDECNDMLVYIANQASDARNRTQPSIFAACRHSLSKGEYFLNQLIHRKYIKRVPLNLDAMGPMGTIIDAYATEQDGLQYLAERGLLK